MEELLLNYSKLVRRVDVSFVRYMNQRINWQAQMIGLVGPRGVGKTTLLLQHIRLTNQVENVIYVSADWYYFSSHKLIDLAAEVSNAGKKALYIDEIHRYPTWSQELKQIYDLYPELQIVFTGSSVLDIYRGASDLSRRVSLYNMQGLSFREYLAIRYKLQIPAITVSEILNHQYVTEVLSHPLPFFRQYLREGYYPYSEKGDFKLHLLQVVQQTLEQDIPAYADMSVSVARRLMQLMNIVAQSVPFKPNLTKLAELIGSSRNYIGDYLLYMERAGMIMQLKDSKSGIRQLAKIEKIYLDNTNLAYALQTSPNIGNIRETFFLNQLRMVGEVKAADKGDFLLDNYIFEVGGRQKQQKQIQGLSNAYIVKDDIEQGIQNIVPLWAFGLLY